MPRDKSKKRKDREAEPGNPDCRSAIILNDSPTPDYADRNSCRVLGVAVNSALRVARQQPYGYLLAATSIRTNPLVQVQGFPALTQESDLDDRNRFVTYGVNTRDLSDSSFSDADDINSDSIDCL